MQITGFANIMKLAADGRILWHEPLVLNTIADEGQQLLFQLAFQDTALTAFFMGLSSGSFTETTTLATMTGEPSSNGYARQTLTRNATDWTIAKNISADHSDTAQAGGASTITLAATASATNDFYRACFIDLTAGLGQGQLQLIKSYVGSTKVATMATAWKVNPDATSVYTVHSDFVVTSKQATFSASGGNWGPVDKLFLCNVASGTAGKLVAYAPLPTSQTVNNGESILVQYKDTLRAGK